MRVGERDEALERVADDPGVRVEQEAVAAAGDAHAGVVAAAHAAVVLLDQPHVGEALAHERHRPVGRAVVDDDRLVTAHRLEALLDARRAFQVTTTTETSSSHPATGTGAPAETPSQRMTTSPGTASRSVIRKKRKPHANADVGADAEPGEEADEERLAHAEPVDRERHQHHEEEQRPEHDVRERRELDPDRASRGPDREDPRELQRRA